MSEQITTAFINQYSSNVTLLSQQKMSRLRPFVRVERMTAEYEYFEQIGPVEAQPRPPRHSDTPLYETPHARRRVETRPYNWADLIDRPDRVRTLIDPTSPYVTNAVMAFNRKEDDIIIRGALAPAFTGYDGSKVVNFPSSQFIPFADGTVTWTDPEQVATTGMTLDKLGLTKLRFWDNEVDDGDIMSAVIVLPPIATLQMLRTTEITNADYNVVRTLVRGDVDTFMGFKFVRTNRLPNRTVGTFGNAADPLRRIWTCVSWVPGAVLLGVGEETTANIDVRPDKNYSTQVYVEMDKGAVRMEEEKVVAFEVVELLPDPNAAAPNYPPFIPGIYDPA